MILTRTTRLLVAGAAIALVSSPAFALDGNDLFKKIVASVNLQPEDVQVAGIDVSGATVTLKGLSIADARDGERMTVGDIVLEGVEEGSDGGYAISKAVFPNVNSTQEDTTITASDLYFANVSIPGSAGGPNVDSFLFYERGHAGPVTVTVKGKQVASIRETTANLERADDNSGISFDTLVDGVTADLSVVDDPKSLETIQSLGLTTINGKISMQGSWEAEPGTINVDEYALDFADVGRLNMSFSLSGYTIGFIKSAQETARASEANPDKEAAKQAAGLAMLGLLQQLTFNNAEISFEDAGITKRGLDYAGKSQGVSGQQMAMMVKGMAPLMLAQLNLPTLQTSLSAAINTFIDNPRNLTITAEPPKPIPLPMIIGAAQAAPNTLPDMLGVTVMANE